MQRFLEKFGFAECDGMAESFARAKEMLAARQNDILAFERYEIFTYMTPDLARIRDALALDTDNLLYAYMLSDAIRSGNTALVKALSFPCREQESELYDTLPLFGMLDHLSDMLAELKRRGLPQDVIDGTCSQFENQIQDFIDLNHRYGISHYVSWMLLFLQCKIIRVGRFNFEAATYRMPFDVFKSGDAIKVLPRGVVFHKSGQILGSVDCLDEEGSFVGDVTETEEYFEGLLIEGAVAKNERIRLSKREWTRVLTAGDPAISIHIPSGGSLPPEIVERDLLRGMELFNRHMGAFAAYICTSWLLDPQIKKLLGKETNLTRFADRFARFPVKSNGGDVFEYVWCMPATTPLAKLPETSSISRTVKAHLLAGGHIFGASGVIV